VESESGKKSSGSTALDRIFRARTKKGSKERVDDKRAWKGRKGSMKLRAWKGRKGSMKLRAWKGRKGSMKLRAWKGRKGL
jgi:hypothetical protein